MFPSLLSVAAAASSSGNHYGASALKESCNTAAFPTVLASKYDYYDDQQGGDDDYNNNQAPARRQPAGNRYVPSEPPFASLLGLLKNQRQLGAGLLGVGLLLTFMGMMLFFEGTLLRLGNIFLIAGIPLLVGPDRVRSFFMKESRLQATCITAVGILLVFWGKPRLGILCEIFGLLNLFGNMFPLLFALGSRLPIVGDILAMFKPSAMDGDERTPRRPAARQPADDFAGGGESRPAKRYTPDF